MDTFFDVLYSRFILRDLFAKIIPGAIPIIVVYCKLAATQGFPLKEIPFSAWVLLYGVSWISGFALQSIGECLPWKFRILYHTEEITDQDFYDLRIESCDRASPLEGLDIERLVVLKEATGNTYVSLIISFFLWVLISYLTGVGWEQIFRLDRPILGLMLLGSGFLLRMHRKLVERQDRFLEQLYSYRVKRPYKKTE